MTSPALRIALVVVAAYVPLCAYYYLVQDRLIFLATGATPPSAPAEDVRLDVDGVTLAGWRVSPDAAVDVVYFGGNAEAVAAHARSFAAIDGARTLLMDYRGYGRSRGTPSEAALVGDATAIVRALTDRERPLLVVGRSLGSGVAALAAARLTDHVDALLLVSPFCSLRNVVALHAPALLPSRTLLRHPFDVTDVAHALPARLTLLLAAQDSIVPPDESRCLARAADVPTAQVIELDGRGHNDVLADDRLWQAIEHAVAELRVLPRQRGSR
jgi:hypothetical protein